MNVAAVVVPGAAAVKVAADAGPMLDILETAGYLAVVDIVPAVDISEVLVDMPAVEPQQVVGMVKFLNHVHNVYNSSLALNSGHNRGSA